MRLTKRSLLWVSLSLAVGCGTSDSTSGSASNALAVSDEQDEEGGRDSRDQDEGEEDDGDGDDGDDEAGGNPEGEECSIGVAFDCEKIDVSTCKDLSNVVLELEDGSRQRYEGLKGYENTFAGSGQNNGKVVVGVWVKSGANHSGDGPGYGERFDAPEDSCEPTDGAEDPPVDDGDEPPADDIDPILL